MKLKIDLHTHSRYSADGIAEPEDMIAEARRKGLHGFAITDHNTCACVDYFLQHGLMNEEGLPVDDLLIIPGQEITTREGHLLALGVRLPDLKGIPAREAVDLIHEHGGVAVPPHPYDFFRAGIKESVLEELRVDAIEVFNAANTLKRHNEKAFEYASKHGLAMTAGSDAHHADAIGTAFTVLKCGEFRLSSVLEAIKTSRETEQKYLSPKDALKKTFSNVFRFKRFRPKAKKKK